MEKIKNLLEVLLGLAVSLMVSRLFFVFMHPEISLRNEIFWMYLVTVFLAFFETYGVIGEVFETKFLTKLSKICLVAVIVTFIITVVVMICNFLFYYQWG